MLPKINFMIAQNTTLYTEFYLTDFFPISDVFSSNDDKLPHILVESIDEETRCLLENSLIAGKYNILESGSFGETRQFIAVEKPEIILLDCVSFQETLIKLRILRESRTSCQIPIIVFLEVEQSFGKREILNAGADDFLLKPLNFQQLEISIEKQIDNRNITFGGLL